MTAKPSLRAGCPEHGRYRGPHAPKTTCLGCWAEYGWWHHHHKPKNPDASKGRAKGGGQSSKAKGRVAVQQVAAMILAAAPWLEEGDVWVKAGAQSGVDLHLSPAALRFIPMEIETKNEEKLSIWAALRQAEVTAREKGELPPVVFFKRAFTQMYVALRAEDFLKLLSALHAKG